MNKLDYTLWLIEQLATEVLKETPDHERLLWVIRLAKELREKS